MDMYIVCWTTVLEKPDKEGNIHKQHYKVFDSGVDIDLKDAIEFQNQLNQNKSVLSSSHLCKVVSSDYT